MKKLSFTAILTAAALLLTSCSNTEEIAYDPTLDETTTTPVTAATGVQEEVTTTSTTKAETTTETTTEETTTAETSVTTTTTAATTEAPKWTEQAISGTMYVNTNGIYSRVSAIQGSAKVKQYKVNDKVTVVALTNTDYYKLNDGSFIHKDYLSNSEVVITTTTTAATTTPAATVSVSSDIESLINSAPLHPMKTNEPDVDAEASKILRQITNSSMSTYQKVLAIYDYIIKSSSYVAGHTAYTDVNYHTMLDYFISVNAYQLMILKEGVCENYSSLFLVLTRAIGLETYLGFGQVSSKSGGKIGHTWAIMKLNGGYYIFDPQVEQNNLVNGKIQYRYFCRSESSAVGTYTYTDSIDTDRFARRSGITLVGDNPRDHAIQLFGNFVVDSDEKSWTGTSM